MMKRIFFTIIFMSQPYLLWAAPMQIEAGQLEIIQKSNKITFSGSVHLTRDNFELFCDRLVAYYQEGSSRLKHADAFGQVRIVQGKDRGSSDKAVFDQLGNTLTLIGDAVLEQPGGLIKGETIIHDMANKRTKVQPVKGGRVHMTLEADEKAAAAVPVSDKQQ